MTFLIFCHLQINVISILSQFQQFQAGMNDIAIKLNQIVTPQQIRSKKRGSLYTLNNSLKRNTMFGFPLSLQQPNYQCKLPQIDFGRRDLAQMLSYLLDKNEMQLPDRNLLRRILLIHAGTREFINHLKMEERRTEEKVKGGLKRFYFLVKGKVRVMTKGFSHQIKEGNTFGQIQILTDTPIQNLQFLSNSLLLTLDQTSFNTYFRHYFEAKYKQKLNKIACISQSFLEMSPMFNVFHLADRIKTAIFNIGDKITDQAKPASSIYFLGDKWPGQKFSSMLSGCLGLQQYFKGKSGYIQNTYCIQEKYQIHYVPTEVFNEFIGTHIMGNESWMKQSFMMKSRIKPTANEENPQSKQKLKSFMRIKKVKLNLKQRVKTESIQPIYADFRFFRTEGVNDFDVHQKFQRDLRFNSQKKSKRLNNSLIQTKNNYNLQ